MTNISFLFWQIKFAVIFLQNLLFINNMNIDDIGGAVCVNWGSEECTSEQRCAKGVWGKYSPKWRTL